MHAETNKGTTMPNKPQNAGAIADRLSASIQQRAKPIDPLSRILDREELAEALDILATRLEFARGLQIENDLVRFLLEELSASGYSEGQFQTAANWILYGDWRFRGNTPKLLLSDFYPTREQIRETFESRAGDLILLDKFRIRALTQDSYRAGWMDARGDKNAIASPETAKDDKVAAGIIRELNSEILNLKSGRIEARQIIAALEDRILALEEDKARYKARAIALSNENGGNDGK